MIFSGQKESIITSVCDRLNWVSLKFERLFTLDFEGLWIMTVRVHFD
ncbi:hypothetical protein SAMN04515674_110103 [Pseudarcicella hirudinis]|uniref:Uncharacterized protein n=1 Tax=Pseudarcicella hirudinis TaxID=1079859 RepID=A0A1I5VWV6_9BACT|nr:hypothetical protein SAMN04515674_110103 [Pseudarcicella hirudinis]